MLSHHKRSFAAEELERQKRKKHPTRWIVPGVIVVLVATAGVALFMLRGKKEKSAETPVPVEEKITSIAVLPFENMSADTDQEYFCDGLTDALIDALTKVKDLKRVIPRTSVFAFKGEHRDIRAIGDSLDVDSVLEGSVVKSDGKIRVTVQLIKVADNTHLFSEHYDYEMTDILTLQDTIAFDVVNALKVTLVEKERAAILKRYTRNEKAYDLYLRGRYYWEKRTTGDFRTALNYYNEAVALDPEYALAYAGIADVYNLMGLHGNIPANDAFPLAQENARKALEIDDTLAEAYNSLAYATLYNDWNWDEAGRLFRKALDLDPYYYLAHWWYKDYLILMNRGSEARDDIQRALERDPLNKMLYLGLATINYSMNACDELWDVTTQYTRIYPEEKLRISYFTGWFYLCTGDYNNAVDTFKYIKTTRNSFLLGIAHAKAGNMQEARKILTEIQKTSTQGTITNRMQIAAIYAALGDHDKAFDVLNKLYEEHHFDLPAIAVYPYYKELKSDPRYKALLKKMNLPAD